MSSQYGTITPARAQKQQATASNHDKKRRKSLDLDITLAYLHTGQYRDPSSMMIQYYYPLHGPPPSSTASSSESSESSDDESTSSPGLLPPFRMLQAQLRNGQVPRPPDGASSPAYLPSKAYLDFDAESQREDNEDHDGLWEYENATCLEGCWERRVVRWCCFFLLLMVAVGIMILVVVAAPRHPHHSRRRLFKRPIVWPDS